MVSMAAICSNDCELGFRVCVDHGVETLPFALEIILYDAHAICLKVSLPNDSAQLHCIPNRRGDDIYARS